MRFPDRETVDAVLDPVTLPPFATVAYEPPAPALDDPRRAAHDAVADLPLDRVRAGGTVAVGLGSRGVTDVLPVARGVVAGVRERGFDPVAIPAMGSHGGASAAGQRRTLAGLGLTEEALGCPIDARMETEVVGESSLGTPVHVAAAALEADGLVVVNRVKPHTNFTGRVESGLSKMATVGLGKQPGARAFHDTALAEGYVPTIEATLDVVREATPLLGGVAVVENAADETGLVEGIAVEDLPDAEEPLLERAREWMPTLPWDDLDVLVVDRIGKDVSGAGMDTNVVGRYRVVNAPDPVTPDITRIVARRLTDATHGNGNGIGLADVTTRRLVDDLDLDQVYTNALTSASLSKAALPVVMPDDERAVRAAVSAIGRWEPGSLRMAWIRDTSHLAEFRVSGALARDPPEHIEVTGWQDIGFDDAGEPVWTDREPPEGFTSDR